MINMFEQSIGGKALINIECSELDQCLAVKEHFGDVFLVGVMAKTFPDISQGCKVVGKLQTAGIRVSAGLGGGSPQQWERALKLALNSHTEHLNQIFPAAALSQCLLLQNGGRTIVNALVRPSGKEGEVIIGTGPLSDSIYSAVSVRTAAAMLKETGVSSIKLYPIEGVVHFRELEAVARAAAEFDMMLEPTGGISPENVGQVVRICLNAGVKHIMPHLYGSLKNESGVLDFYKMEKAVKEISMAVGG